MVHKTMIPGEMVNGEMATGETVTGEIIPDKENDSVNGPKKMSGTPSPLNRGFTLLEVLVSLSIVAVGVAAAAKMITQSVTIRNETEKRFIANLVSSNSLSELVASPSTQSGVSSLSENMGGHTWEVKVSNTATPNPDIIRIDVSSALKEGNSYGQLFYYKARLNKRNNGS